MISYPKSVDLNKYKKEDQNPDAFYGLPKLVCYCKKCVISNQRPNSGIEYSNTKETKKVTINFDENGVCDACIFAEKKEA